MRGGLHGDPHHIHPQVIRSKGVCPRGVDPSIRAGLPAAQGLCDTATEDSTLTMLAKAAPLPPPPFKQEQAGGEQEVPVMVVQRSTATALSR